MQMENIPRPEYPRPELERPEWLNLNGEWNFDFDDTNVGEKEKWYVCRAFTRKIIVPFCFQSKLSGIEDTSFHETVWYCREFAIPDGYLKKRVILNFGAVDYFAKVWVNGEMAGTHTGGYTPFQFDITDFLKDGNNVITARVEDKSSNTSQLRGKQKWMKENFGCWYTQVTGIWQTVWLEAVADTHIDRIKITPDIDAGDIKLEVCIYGGIDRCMLKAYVSFGGIEINEFYAKVARNRFHFAMDIKSDRFERKIETWSPSEPNLYDIRYELTRDGVVIDRAASYFGMRKVSARNGAVLLNNQPIYQRLVLDQGYFNGGLLTAARDEEYIRDIEMVRELGFNGVRKHQKAEDPRFLYWADKLGILVWGEMGSAYEFNDEMITGNTNEWRSAVERDYNHPCIIAWTLMNESWGIPNLQTDKKQQCHAMSLYYMVKSYDDTRIVISNDGWEHTVSDVITFHDYTQDGEALSTKISSKERILQEPVCSIGNELGAKYLFAEGFKYGGQPILLSECCGVAFDNKSGWGYGQLVRTEEELLKRYEAIMRAIYAAGYIAGFCCTQLTDVEQETNGLLTIDRRPKVDSKAFSRIIIGEGL